MIGIVDTHAGNLTSVRAALDRLRMDHVTLEAPRLEGIHTLLVPGQGRFAAVMETLDAREWREPLLEWHAADRPLLGICVGQQILFETSDEDPGARGLGILPGHVEKLAFPKSPMVGWAPVAWTPEASGERDLASGDAYFVNSYAVRKSDAAIATTTYGETFVSAVRKGKTVAVQFHPEKSGTWGQAVLGQLLAR